MLHPIASPTPIQIFHATLGIRTYLEWNEEVCYWYSEDGVDYQVENTRQMFILHQSHPAFEEFQDWYIWSELI